MYMALGVIHIVCMQAGGGGGPAIVLRPSNVHEEGRGVKGLQHAYAYVLYGCPQRSLPLREGSAPQLLYQK